MRSLRNVIPFILLTCLWVGCAENPGTWPQDKVEAKIMESLEFTEVTLSPADTGGFTGSGQREDGETVTLVITQDPEAHRLSWEARGDRGLFEDGFFELK